MKHHMIAIVPALSLDAANKLAEGFGWGPDNFSVPLSEGGTQPATHYALSTLVSDSVVKMIADTDENVVADIVFSIQDASKETPKAHFEQVCSDENLQIVSEE